MKDEKRPDVLEGHHPLERKEYVAPTPMIIEAWTECERWIRLRLPGNTIVGETGSGKSWFRKYAVQETKTSFRNIQVYSSLIIASQSPNDRAFFAGLCRCTDHLAAIGEYASNMRFSLSQHLLLEAERTGERRVVFFFDNAHNLTDIEYRWLIDLSDDLAERSLHCTMILIGQPELVSKRTDLLRDGLKQIAGRFMNEVPRFNVFSTKESLAAGLKCFDDPEVLEYPAGSGWSYTRYFFPKAYRNGWKLVSIRDVLWEAFDNVRLKNGVGTKIPFISASSFFGVIECILTIIGDRSQTEPRISVAELEQYAVSCGYGVIVPDYKEEGGAEQIKAIRPEVL